MSIKERWLAMWQLWSIRLGIVASGFIAWMAAYPQDWQALVERLPESIRPIVGVIAFAAIAYTRMKPQGAK